MDSKQIIKHLKKAIKYFDEAIKLDPKNAEAYNNRANLILRLGDYKKAITNFDKAIELNPQFAEAYYDRADAKFNSSEYKPINLQSQPSLDLLFATSASDETKQEALKDYKQAKILFEQQDKIKFAEQIKEINNNIKLVNHN